MLSDFDDYPHSRDAYVYAQHVVNGHVPACKWIRLACKRFLDDLENGELGYTYDREKADRACRFIEKLPHIKGKWAAKREKTVLQAWQKFIVCNLFGWVDAKGLRRFREAYLQIPRKNGKSHLAACIALYMFVADGEYGAEIYSGATSEKQAWEVFRPAKLMAQRTPELVERFGIDVNAKNMIVIADNSKFEPIIGNPGDGSSPSCAIVDEYHEHDTDDLYDTMQTGMGAREQPLMLVITTAGSNLYGPCDEKRKDVEKVLDGIYENDRLFGAIYTVDEEEEWSSEEALIKANPNIDVSVSREYLLDQLKEAKRKSTKQNTYRRKHLNQWVGAGTAYFNMLDWFACEDKVDIETWAGMECIATIDLATKIDIACRMLMFWQHIDGKRHVYFYPRFYLPEDVIYTANEQYPGWAEKGFIVPTPGNVIDYEYIENDLQEIKSKYQIHTVGYDPFQATQFSVRMIQEGFPMMEYGATVKNFSDPMKELDALMQSRRLHHDGNPVLSWMVSNVVASEDLKGNVFPRKESKGTKSKIDGAITMIMALGILALHEPEEDIDAFLSSPIAS